MRSLTIAIVLAAVGLPSAILAQQPVLDLAISDLTYTCLPGGGGQLDAEVQLATMDSIGAFTAEVRFLIDGIHVSSGFFQVDSKAQSSCEQLGPPCDTPLNTCFPAIINGKVVDGECVKFFVIPQAPDTCLCVYFNWESGYEWVPGKESTVCTAEIDPDSVIAEIVETNNSMTIIVGPSAVQGTIWGTIKALYR